MISSFLPDKTGAFTFRDDAAGVTREITVHYARPSSGLRDAAITFAMHGLDRAAVGFRDVMAAHAERNGQLVLVPEFDLRQFPDIHAYNFGGVQKPPPESTVLPRGQWNFGIVDRLFAHVRNSIESGRTGYNLFGNSAGAQFVLRYLALNEATLVEQAVASNSGIFMLPDLSTDYPTGMGGIGLRAGDVRRFLTRPLTILIGELDSDPLAHDLPRGEAAEAQGPHRLARAQWYMAHCSDLARTLDVKLGWRCESVAGAGHVSQAIYDRASDIMAD